MEIYNGVFGQFDFAQIVSDMSRSQWRYGHGSLSKTHSIPFWEMLLTDEQFYNDYLLNIIRDLTDEPELELERVYANGHVFGDKALPHTDGNYDDCRTFLLYSNHIWKHTWGGKTAFLGSDKKWTYVEPAPNKAVFFDGRMTHYAEDLSRTFNSLRTTIAWKLNGATRKLHY